MKHLYIYLLISALLLSGCSETKEDTQEKSQLFLSRDEVIEFILEDKNIDEDYGVNVVWTKADEIIVVDSTQKRYLNSMRFMKVKKIWIY